jgi:hypothetical protein
MTHLLASIWLAADSFLEPTAARPPRNYYIASSNRFETIYLQAMWQDAALCIIL